jgi:hypothetical protein
MGAILLASAFCVNWIVPTTRINKMSFERCICAGNALNLSV